MKRFLASCALVACVATAPLYIACAPPPATLTPAGVVAFQEARVVQALDVLRDTAIAANAQVPPLISTSNTRAIVTYHEAALKTIQAGTAGWQAALNTGLDQLVASLSAKEATVVAPYVTLIKTAIKAVTA